MDKEYLIINDVSEDPKSREDVRGHKYLYKYITNKETKFFIRSIVPPTSLDEKIYLCSGTQKPTSCQFIFIPGGSLEKINKGEFTVKEYIDMMSKEGVLQQYRTIMDNTFQNIVNSAGTLEVSEDNNSDKPNLDLGLDESLIYAYIMTHTDPSNYFYIRFFDWENIDGKQRGFRKNTFSGKTPRDILNIFNISEPYFESIQETYNPIYGCDKDFIMIPTLTTEGKFESNHISSIIIKRPFFNFSEPYIYSFDTMGGENAPDSHAKLEFFNKLPIQILQQESMQGKSGCGFYTSFFFEECLSKDCLEKIIQQEIQTRQQNLNQEIIQAIKSKFDNLIATREQVLQISQESKQKSKVKKGGKGQHGASISPSSSIKENNEGSQSEDQKQEENSNLMALGSIQSSESESKNEKTESLPHVREEKQTKENDKVL